MRRFTSEQGEFIRTNVVGRSTAELTALVNKKFNAKITLSQIRTYKKNHKLSSGLTGRFEKGHVPFNKGVKGIRVSPATEFKKGNMPHNHKPVGSERITRDGYTEIKIAEPETWKLKHRLIWEEHNGPIPKGSVVIFLDQNKQNLKIENLRMIQQRQLSVLNHKKLLHNNAKATETGIIIADVLLKIGDRKGRKYQKKRKEEPT